MRLGLLGSGNVAQALATAWATAGHDVVMGSRRPKGRTAPGIPVTGGVCARRPSTVRYSSTPPPGRCPWRYWPRSARRRRLGNHSSTSASV
ncbi:NAD(P)-binding domain-containing protein [Streptomyces sp. R-74717]|uniref:NAD(P)-binding domain-containing protein n=1 Tax=Streptomyces sp. R-74717 TaxID=2969820 RepID=UPI0039B4CB39